MLWGCGTCPPVVTAATKLGDGDSLEMILLIKIICLEILV